MENLIDRKQAAELLGVKTSWLDHKRAAGEGPAYFEIGGFVRYSVADIKTWLAGHRKVSPLEFLAIDWHAAAPSGDTAADQPVV